jgi:hypothetical protein
MNGVSKGKRVEVIQGPFFAQAFSTLNRPKLGYSKRKAQWPAELI